MELHVDIDECEWCNKYYPLKELRRVPIFFGWCYQLICKECDKKP